MNVKNWTVCVIEPNKFEAPDHHRSAAQCGRRQGARSSPTGRRARGARSLQRQRRDRFVRDGAAWTAPRGRAPSAATRSSPGRKAAIFITSGAFSRAMAEECRHAGANALIGKPLSAKVLTGDDQQGADAAARVHRRGRLCRPMPPRRHRHGRRAEEAPQGRRFRRRGGARTRRWRRASRRWLPPRRAYAADASQVEPCEAALRHVQAYAVNAGDGPLMRACAAFALQLSSAKGLRPEAVRAVAGSVRQWRGEAGRRSDADQAARREEIAEGVRQAVGKAAMQRAA